MGIETSAPQQPTATRDPRFQISVRGVRKTFHARGVEQEVLRGIDLDFERGRINVVIGGSGAGKSVFMKLLIGLLRADQGSICVDGEDITRMNDFDLNRVRRKFGMMFQYAALFDSMTVEENVMFPLVEHRRKELKRAVMREMVQQKLETLGLFNVGHKFPAELSGGMRKRVGLARAIILEPEILFYDEPTTGLDPVATKNVDDMIAEISEALGVTTVVISHDMASTFRIAHKISMLSDGEIIANGSPHELLRSSRPELREFLETSGAVALVPLEAGGPA